MFSACDSVAPESDDLKVRFNVVFVFGFIFFLISSFDRVCTAPGTGEEKVETQHAGIRAMILMR